MQTFEKILRRTKNKLQSHIRSIVTTMEDSLAISGLVPSIEVTQLLPVTAPIKTLAEKEILWRDMTTRLI